MNTQRNTVKMTEEKLSNNTAYKYSVRKKWTFLSTCNRSILVTLAQRYGFVTSMDRKTSFFFCRELEYPIIRLFLCL